MAEIARTDEADQTTLRIGGALDAAAAPDLRAVVDQLQSDGRLQVTLDLSALVLIDSSGCGVIVGFIKRTRAAGGEVRIVGLTGQPKAVFRMLRLDRVFPI
jgi:anti-sigma B factor antagonist